MDPRLYTVVQFQKCVANFWLDDLFYKFPKIMSGKFLSVTEHLNKTVNLKKMIPFIKKWDTLR